MACPFPPSLGPTVHLALSLLQLLLSFPGQSSPPPTLLLFLSCQVACIGFSRSAGPFLGCQNTGAFLSISSFGLRVIYLHHPLQIDNSMSCCLLMDTFTHLHGALPMQSTPLISITTHLLCFPGCLSPPPLFSIAEKQHSDTLGLLLLKSLGGSPTSESHTSGFPLSDYISQLSVLPFQVRAPRSDHHRELAHCPSPLCLTCRGGCHTQP